MAAKVMVVRLLGEPAVTLDGRPVEALVAPRLRSLLALLIVHRTTGMVRQRAAFMLWPDSTEAQARTNLRHALHHLKRALPDADRHIDIDSALIGWRADSEAQVDIIDLEIATAAAADSGRAALERAVAAYTGALLQGHDDEWLEPFRARLHRRHVGHLERIADLCDRDGDTAAAIQWSHELLQIDPLQESAYRRLIRLYGSTDRARAVRTFHACVATLERELGVSPSPETVATYARIVAPPASAGATRSVGLVGRVAERARVIEAVRTSCVRRTGTAILLRGEAGIGKSHLAADVMAWCDRHGLATVTTRAYEAEGRLPLAPIADVLRSPPMRPALDRLEPLWRNELARIVPDVLSGEVAGANAALLDAGGRTRLFAAVSRAVEALDGPLVVAIDDLQWCDPTTLELLHFVLRTAGGVSFVVIGTARDEGLEDGPLGTFVDGLHSLDGVVDVPLERLADADARRLVEATLGGRAQEDVVGRVVAAAGGNPLYVVEMARAGIDPATGQVNMPEKVHSVIERRLAALSADARSIVDALAVLGRAADLGLLDDVAQVGEPADALDELWRRRILVEAGADGYDFAHDRIRDVAYADVGPGRRRALHGRAGDLLATRWAADLDEVAAPIAYHFERAGRADVAIDHYRRAMVAAGRVYAHGEVLALGKRALELLAHTPAGSKRTAREMSVLGLMAVAVYVGPGATPATDYVFERIAACQTPGGPPLDAAVRRITANWAITNRRFAEPDRIGAELVARGEQASDPLLLTEGNYLRGVSSFWLGRLPASAQHLERSLALYDEASRDVHLQQFGQDPQAVCLVRLAMTWWHLGRIEAAADLRHRAQVAAAATCHPYTIGYVIAFGAWAAHDAGADDELDALVAGAQRWDNRFVALATEAFAVSSAARRDPDPVHVERLAAVAESARVEQRMFEPKALLLLAEALGSVGNCDGALVAVRRARGLGVEMPIVLAHAWWTEATLLRRFGAPVEEVGAALDATIEVACAQGALTLAQRARAARAAWGDS